MSLLCLLAYASFDDNILVRVLFGEQFSLTGLNCLSYSCVFIPDVFFTSVWTMTKFFLCFFEGFHGFPIKKSTSSCPRTKNHLQPQRLMQFFEGDPTTRDCTVGISHFARSKEWRYACVLLDAMPRMNVKRKLLGEWCRLSFCHMGVSIVMGVPQ